MAESARDEPSRHEPDRSRGTQAEPRACSRCPTSSNQAVQRSAVAGGSTCDRRPGCRPAAGRGRRGVHRPGPGEHARQRREVRRPDARRSTVLAARRGDGMVRVTIEDGGPGVPAEALPRLFEKFYRVPRKGEGSRRGTGIGLSVVRGLVDAMGGRVTARPSSLGGLAIDIDLPAAPARRRDEPRPPGASADPPGRGRRGDAPSDRDVPAWTRPRGPRGRCRLSGDRGVGGTTAGPDHPGPGAARPRWTDRRPPRPARGDDSGPGPLGARSRGRQGRRAGPRRRRLRDQAVRDDRAAGQDRCPAPKGRRTGGGCRRASSRSAIWSWISAVGG